MRIISWKQLVAEGCALSNLSAIDLYTTLKVYTTAQKGRGFSGLIYMLEGDCAFEWEDHWLSVPQGGLVFVPIISHHTYRETRGPVRYIRLNFLMQDLFGHAIDLYTRPTLIMEQADEKVRNLCTRLPQLCVDDALLARSCFFELLSHLASIIREASSQETVPNQIAPALSLIHSQNYSLIHGLIPTKDLATMCNLSETHFRRLFLGFTGMTPTRYQNRQRMRIAKQLLRNTSNSIADIAQCLGFNSPFYFSRIFGEEEGVSPSEYRRETAE